MRPATATRIGMLLSVTVFARAEPRIAKIPNVTAFKITKTERGPLSVSALLSDPAFVVDDVPVVVFYRPTFTTITITRGDQSGDGRHLKLGGVGRGIRMPDAQIPLLDQNQKEVGSLRVADRDFQKVIFKVPSGWVTESSQFTLSRRIKERIPEAPNRSLE